MAMRDRRIISRWVLGVIAVISALVAMVLARGSVDAVAIVREVRAGRELAMHAEVRWREEGVRAAQEIRTLLDDASVRFRRVDEIAESSLLAFLPGTRGALAFLRHVALVGVEWTASARNLAAIAGRAQRLTERFADRAPADLTVAERAELTRTLGASIEGARRARSTFADSEATLRSLRCPWIFSASGFCRSGRMVEDLLPTARMASLQTALARLMEHADAALALFGSGEPRDILLLFLNNTELRPGGGFLGTYGLLTLHRGEVVDFRTDDVYNLDRTVEDDPCVPPPEPFRRHGIVSCWYLRDANWSPDFAASTRVALDAYRREGGPGNPAVVLGFTPTFAAAILRIIGPVVVDATRFTAENIADELEYQVEQGYFAQGIPRPQRKAIIAPLSREVVDRLLRMPFRAWGPIVSAVRTAIRERHLMASAVDARLDAALDALDVTGRVRSVAPGEDALLVVDANLGALKTDSVVERSIRYAIEPDGDGFTGTVRLRYRNTGTFTWKTTRYRTYTRVYLPEETALLRVRGAMARDRSSEPGLVDHGREFGRTWFGAFLSVEPGEERELEFTFTLAPAIIERIRSGQYHLEVHKQLGSTATPLTVDLEFGSLVRAASPPELPAAWGDGRYQVETDLREDRRFAVEVGTR